MSDELKPCPFCGGTELETLGSNDHYVRCSKCRAEGPTASIRMARSNFEDVNKRADALAKEAWNTRPGEDRARREGFEWLLDTILKLGFDTGFSVCANIDPLRKEFAKSLGERK